MNKVVSADHELVRKTLLDFRWEEGGQKFVVRMKGEGRFRSSVFPEFDARGRRVLLEYIPESRWYRPALPLRWLAAIRVPYVLFSLFPLLLAASRFFAQTGALPLAETALLFFSVILVHCSCNLWGEYEDHLRGVDAPEHSSGSGVIQKLWIPALHIRNAAMVSMAAGILLGLWLLSLLPLGEIGIPLFWLGLAGGLGAASYSGWPFHYKYVGLGEPIVFLLSGPIVTLCASLIFLGKLDFSLALASLPLAFLAILRLHGGNMQRAPFDTMAGVFTIARQLGFGWSKAAFGFLLFAPFFSVMTLQAAGIAPRAAVACGLTLPFVVWSYLALLSAQGPLDPACKEFRKQAARLHIFFGLLYSLSFLFP